MAKKMVFVSFGKCHTCGKELEKTVTEEDFHGSDEIAVDVHCGEGGHNLYSGRVTRAEFDAANHLETI